MELSWHQSDYFHMELDQKGQSRNTPNAFQQLMDMQCMRSEQSKAKVNLSLHAQSWYQLLLSLGSLLLANVASLSSASDLLLV